MMLMRTAEPTTLMHRARRWPTWAALLGMLTLTAACAETVEAGGSVREHDLDEQPSEQDQPFSELAAESTAEAAATCTTTGPATAKTPRIYVVGDSTASDYANNLAPRMGWAQPLQDFFTAACASVQNKALSGRSSKSFIDEGAWTPVRNALRSGDWVLIQFGHNDEKDDDPTRFTSANGTYPQYLSRYVDDALAKGARPVLLTSINRNKWSNGKLTNSHGAYPDAVRQLAAKRQVPLVDMTALTKAYFERIGQAETTKLFLSLKAGQSPNYPRGVEDATHLQERGARVIARIALADLARQKLPLGSLVKAVVAPP